ARHTSMFDGSKARGILRIAKAEIFCCGWIGKDRPRELDASWVQWKSWPAVRITEFNMRADYFIWRLPPLDPCLQIAQIINCERSVPTSTVIHSRDHEQSKEALRLRSAP